VQKNGGALRAGGCRAAGQRWENARARSSSGARRAGDDGKPVANGAISGDGGGGEVAAVTDRAAATGPRAKSKRQADGLRKFDGRVQQRMERMFGAIPHSDKATPTPRLNPFRSFGG